MLIRTIAFLVGIIVLSFQSNLFPQQIIYVLLLICPFLLIRNSGIVLVLWFLCGFIWSNFIANISLNHRIDPILEGQDVLATGSISSIPEKFNRRTRFEFRIDSIVYEDIKFNSPNKVMLNWYGNAPKLLPDEQWQLVLRLKKPFGNYNPGGFDYESWMFQQGINAKGYVRKSDLNIKLASVPSLFSINTLRLKIKDQILDTNTLPTSAIILALLIGDRSAISKQQWRIFRITGTSHLIAISGLHIGLIAALVFFLARWLWGSLGTAVELYPAPKFAAIITIIVALFYAALAGFSLPTQRALIMLCVIMFSILVNVRVQKWKTLSIALLLVLIVSPFAILNPGFWLSYIAVAIIMYFADKTASKTLTLNSTLNRWFLIQLVITIGLVPLVLLFFKESSIISPIANFVVVPIFSFFIVPLVFIGGCLILISPIISQLLFSIVNYILLKVWWYLEYLAQFSYSSFKVDSVTIPAFIFSVIAIVLLFLPRKFPAKYLTLIFFIPLFYTKAEKPKFGEAIVTLLDVGQGLAVAIRTLNHTLIYDTGPKYSKTYDTGATVVVPFLKSNGISKVDILVISHGDNDHIGGMNSILNTVKVVDILTSIPDKIKLKITEPKIHLCNTDTHWNWDGVKFEIIHPQVVTTLKNNNASCVLRISTNKGNAVLLTGDIEKQAEIRMLNNPNIQISADILVAPHHGSKTSSTEAFIKAVNPNIVLYPVGYRNRYRFPAKIIANRYDEYNIQAYSTSESGAIEFILTDIAIKKPELYRVTHRRFWHN